MATYLTNDTDLGAVADAIRTKGGTSGQLVFPGGFVDAIDAISGGGPSADDYAQRLVPTGEITTYATTLYPLAFSGPYVTKVFAPNATKVCGAAFFMCTNLTEVYLPNVTSCPVDPDGSWAGGQWKNCAPFEGCVKLRRVYLPSLITSTIQLFGTTAHFGNTSSGLASSSGKISIILPKISRTTNVQEFRGNYAYYEGIDLGATYSYIGNNSFYQGNYSTCKLILRREARVTAGNGDALVGIQASKGTTIYIPKVMYDELGTGSARDYMAATNWSAKTFNWAQIEGSEFEDAYVDGTPIPVDIPVQYNLTNCTSSNTDSLTKTSLYYKTTLTPNSGYSTLTVTVTRGGTDVTSSVYNSTTGEISVIANAALVITATAS